MARVVVDAEGGDHGLSVVLDGVCRLSMEDTTIQMLLVGDADAITEALETRRHNPARIQVRHSGGAVPMAEDPRAALESRPDCSILVAMKCLAAGEADALVSAGHTGATILAASRTSTVFQDRRAAGCRPQQRSAWTKIRSRSSWMLAPPCPPQRGLGRFAVMGSAYASVISNNPSNVALLSNGTEPRERRPSRPHTLHWSTTPAFTSSAMLRGSISRAERQTWSSAGASWATWCSRCSKG